MPRIFLHVGLPKTGTTYLQNSFEWLEKQSQFQQVSYPLTKTHDSFLAISSGNGIDVGHYLTPRLTPVFQEDVLQEKLGALLERVHDKNRNVLISSEFFSKAPTDRIAAMRSYLLQLGFEVELIVVVRPLSELLFSTYIQSVKRRALDITFDQWVVPVARDLPGSYIRSIMAYDLPVHVLPYDREFLLESVLQIIGENQHLSPRTSKTLVNRSLARNETELMVRVNATFKSPALATKISDGLIYDFPDRKSANMTDLELRACVEAIANTEPPLESYTDPAEQQIVKLFVSAPSHVTARDADSSREQLIDSRSVAVALEFVREHVSFEPAPVPEPELEPETVPEFTEEDIPAEEQVDSSLQEALKPYAPTFKKLALELEQHNLSLALDIMRFAYYGRPNRPAINRKIQHYKKQMLLNLEPDHVSQEAIALLKSRADLFQKVAHELEPAYPEQAAVLASYANMR